MWREREREIPCEGNICATVKYFISSGTLLLINFLISFVLSLPLLSIKDNDFIGDINDDIFSTTPNISERDS